MAVNHEEEFSMGEMLSEIDKSMKRIHIGDIIEGKVISVTNNEVLVNIGYMTDGVITREELSDDPEVNPKEEVTVGEPILVQVLEINDGEGNVALSKKEADAEKVWIDLEEALQKQSTFDVKISEAVKGGVIAYVKGARAFIPASQVSTAYVKDLNEYIGKELTVKVLELDKEKKRIVLTRKAVEQQELEIKKDRLWSSLKKGEKRTGTVTRLAKFGAFVDLGGLDGLIHLSDLSWKRVTDPSQVVKVGDVVDVYIIDVSKEKGRISLALKEVNQNPWVGISSRHKVGETIEGTVVRLTDFGAFVEIEPGIEGLVHLSQISDERILKPSSVLHTVDKVRVKILDINEAENKMSLSIKDASNQESQELAQYSSEEGNSVTLGDLFKDKLKDFKFEK